jgi:hypothetical protein
MNYARLKGRVTMISRIWHGWTSRENADKYEMLLKEEIFAGIKDRNIHGLRGNNDLNIILLTDFVRMPCKLKNAGAIQISLRTYFKKGGVIFSPLYIKPSPYILLYEDASTPLS